MQKEKESILYSASDLCNFLDCEHITKLDHQNLLTPLSKTPDGEYAELIQKKGHEHEARYLAYLKSQNNQVIDIGLEADSLNDKVKATHEAMKAGVDVIYQAAFKDGIWMGHADFLLRVQHPSNLGEFSYEVADTKLARSSKAKFVVQLGFYSQMVAKVQGLTPSQMHVVLGDMRTASYRFLDYDKYIQNLQSRFIENVNNPSVPTYPDPCAKCDQCRWSGLCDAQRNSDDHLSQVANITKIQIKKLQKAGITRLEQLAQFDVSKGIPKIATDTLEKIAQQARLQYQARLTGKRDLELLPLIDPTESEESSPRGFARLPEPNDGDLFFDMEGDPLEEGGLEYLFGVYHFENGKWLFKAFWSHNRQEEKKAFENFIDFVVEQLKRYPNAYIYHYASYEETALKRLMTVHGTRESQVDNLLRQQKLVDLYKVVKEAIRISEPSYSIKYVERFYRDEKRDTAVTQGAGSVVHYEHWKETHDDKLLIEIEEYNKDDVVSTLELRNWLIKNRPADLAWRSPTLLKKGQGANDLNGMSEIELKLADYRDKLIGNCSEDQTTWSQEDQFKNLVFQLLDFHRRSQKPQWWAKFGREEMSLDELKEDAETLAGLQVDGSTNVEKIIDNKTYRFTYPEQETKLKSGDRAMLLNVDIEVDNLEIDESQKVVQFTCSKSIPLANISLVPTNPLQTKPLPEAVMRFAESVIENNNKYPAIESVLKRSIPKIIGKQAGQNLIVNDSNNVESVINVISNMDHTHLFIQGPPGAGKTYTGSKVIVAILKQGFKVGIASNSHKAIHNLLAKVDEYAAKDQVALRGAKKISKGNLDSRFESPFFDNNEKTDKIAKGTIGDQGYNLVAGTAWFFASTEMNQKLDYLFVDEAGQIALANLVAMGTSTKNIVLLGDQMQLGQPVQGSHPGRSGESTLDYLLDGLATIPSERGIFLANTWRLHPDICSFISDAVYDGRLQSEASTINQKLLLQPDAHSALKPTGIRYIPAIHDGCSQRSEQEANLVKEIIESLLQQSFIDSSGNTHPLSIKDILIVAPYNQQVNLLKRILQKDAQVGTVDKFQGQEAQVVIMSMTTSSAEEMPRHMEFLFSKNRINVALSRARCLAIFIANPELMAIPCSTPEQMALVNTLCWIKEIG